jgi:hypothetical protein
MIDYRFKYVLPDGDEDVKTVYKQDSEEQARETAADEISNFEDVPADQIKLTVIAKGDFEGGNYYECEGCT